MDDQLRKLQRQAESRDQKEDWEAYARALEKVAGFRSCEQLIVLDDGCANGTDCWSARWRTFPYQEGFKLEDVFEEYFDWAHWIEDRMEAIEGIQGAWVIDASLMDLLDDIGFTCESESAEWSLYYSTANWIARRAIRYLEFGDAEKLRLSLMESGFDIDGEALLKQVDEANAWLEERGHEGRVSAYIDLGELVISNGKSFEPWQEDTAELVRRLRDEIANS